MNKIVFIGAGNLATHLAIELSKLDFNISQIYSRTEKSSNTLAELVNASSTNDISKVSTEADFYIFSIKDSALEDVISRMPHNKGIWIHTAGSMPISVFEHKTELFGVLYPLQTFSKLKEIDWDEIPLFIEGSNSSSHSKISSLANALSKNVYTISSEKRRYVHASAVFACNFTNHMYELADRLVKRTDLPFDILLPLIDETCNKIHELRPQEAQTGPAIRFDQNVMNKHLELLEDEKSKNIYKLLSESIHESHRDTTE